MYLTSGTIVRTILFLILFYVLYLLLDLILILLTSVVIASAVEPATKWFGKFKISRTPAVTITYIIIAMLISGFFYLFIPPLLDEAGNLVAVFPQYIESFSVPDNFGGGLTDTGKIVGGLSGDVSIKDIIADAKDIVSGFSGGIFEAISVTFGGAFSFLMMLIISFYLAVQENGISNFLKLITPVQHHSYVVNLWKRSQKKIGLWFQGQLLMGVLIGVLVYLGLIILQVPYALLLAILAGVFELIPIFGPILAAVPAVMLGFSDGGTSLGFMTLGLYLIMQQFENYLIYPLVVKKVTGVPPLLVIITLIIGANLAGFLGMILSVPVAAALVEFTDDIAKEHGRGK